MNVLLFNLKTDVGDTTLGFTTSWVNAIARYCERVVVVTLSAGDAPIADNVEVHALAQPGRRSSRAHKVLAFYRLAAPLVRSRRIDVCFAHMTPLLAILFAPIGRRHGIPTLLWYAHGSSSIQLRLAHRLVDRCVTSTRAGFPIESDKVFVLSQGIDTDRFVPAGTPGPEYRHTVLSIARLTRRKRLDEILEALALLRREHADPIRLVSVGGAITREDRAYEEELRGLIQALDLEHAVVFEQAVPFHRIADVYRLGSVFVNVSETGSLDKAILEAMASGCIPVSRNRSFAQLARAEGFERLVPDAGPEALARCIKGVLDLRDHEQEALRARLRSVVVRNHSLDALSEQIAAHLRDLAELRPRGRRSPLVARR
jgi:glycosyltransferase involved in cell wall biosynthesis